MKMKDTLRSSGRIQSLYSWVNELLCAMLLNGIYCSLYLATHNNQSPTSHLIFTRQTAHVSFSYFSADVKPHAQIGNCCDTHLQQHMSPYLLGLLAMIKCSICSYQCDNWYVSNWRLACHINFSLGRRSLELAQRPSRVALAPHIAGSSTPFWVTFNNLSFFQLHCVLSQPFSTKWQSFS